MKAAILYFMLTFFPIILFGQEFEFPELNNDSLKHHIILESHKTKSGFFIDYPVFFVYVRLNDREKAYLKSLNYDEWMELLQGPNTDWSANLILYYLSLSDGVTLMSIKKDEWRTDWKQKDIKRWKAFLSDSTNKLIFSPPSDSLMDRILKHNFTWDSAYYLWKFPKMDEIR